MTLAKAKWIIHLTEIMNLQTWGNLRWIHLPAWMRLSLLALLLCRPQIFSHILQREFQDSSMKHLSRKFTEWVYGPVHCYLYDVASLDSYEDNSVMEILTYSSDIPVSAVVTSPFRASVRVILLSNIGLLLSPPRTATRCSRRSPCANCWKRSGRSLQVECFSFISWSTSCTWSSSLSWLTIRRMERWAANCVDLCVPDRLMLTLLTIVLIFLTATISHRKHYNRLSVYFRSAGVDAGQWLFLRCRGMYEFHMGNIVMLWKLCSSRRTF